MKLNAAILTVGDELLLGDRIDSNGPWISRALLQSGIETSERCSVPDSISAISQAIVRLATQNTIVFVTGGLGPTEDDRTREAFASALGVELLLDEEALASIEKWFTERGATKHPQNDVQALRPASATWIENHAGSAPGLLATLGSCTVVCLPGPPSELHPMYAAILPEILAPLSLGGPVKTTEVHAWGMPESIAGDKIADLMQLSDPKVAILMSTNGITARVTSADEALVAHTVLQIQERWSPWFYGVGDETLASSVGEILNGTLATAESCTAGLLSDAIAQTSGASDWFVGGWVTYANSMKMSQLGIASELLSTKGAVSYEVAVAMSEGAVTCSGAVAGLSTTGIAGPSGGTEHKPVGTLFIACTLHGKTTVREFRFTGNRNEIRQRASSTALQMLRFQLLDMHVPTMCWQYGKVIS